MEFEIALKEDLPEIVKIYNETIDSRMATADTKYVTVEERQEWFQAHQEPTRPLWVIKVRGVIAGWISFSSFYGDQLICIPWKLVFILIRVLGKCT